MSDLTDIEKALYGNAEEDPELLAELLALETEEEPVKTSPVRAAPAAPKRRNVKFGEIDKLARQISVEATVQDDENDASVEQDDDLLGELQDLLVPTAVKQPDPVKVSSHSVSPQSNATLHELEQRLEKYKETIVKAKNEGNDRRMRQTQRIQKQYEQAIRSVKAGKPVDLEELPTPAGFGTVPKSPTSKAPVTASEPPKPPVPEHKPKPPLPAKPSSPPPAATVPQSSPPKLPKIPIGPPIQDEADKSEEDILAQMKRAAIDAKRKGDMETAKDIMRQIKMMSHKPETVQVTVTGATSQTKVTTPSSPDRTEQEKPGIRRRSSSEPRTPPAPAAGQTSAKTPLEALEQRLNKYMETVEKAKTEGNDRRARQSQRIVKQYQQAIRSLKAGKNVDFDELPTPPGFGPIPTGNIGAQSANTLPQPDVNLRKLSESDITPPQPKPRPAPRAGPTQPVPRSPTVEPGPSPPKQSRQEQQYEFLMTRHGQFKEAALMAKRNGNMNLAKEYLRSMKGLEPMIEASGNGLPVDIKTIPVPPQLKSNRKLESQLSTGETTSSVTVESTPKEIYAQLEKDLIHQIQVCGRNVQFFSKLGDIAESNKFEKMANICHKDIVTLRQAAKRNDPLPRFRYEMRTFPSLECCPDLGEDDIEIIVVRGIQLKLPPGYEEKHADIYVKFELGYPQENPQSSKTNNIEESTSPAFGDRIKFKINRKARQFQRLVKRHGIKFEVIQRGGFLRSDKSLGSCEVKLVNLETHAEIHESLDLLEGRKPIGGKLEVKVRIREPLVENKATQIQEKWLIIDHFVAVKPPKVHNLPKVPMGQPEAPRALPKIPTKQPGLRRMY